MLFLTGMLPTAGREAKFVGRIGAELDVKRTHGRLPGSGQRSRRRAAAFGIAGQVTRSFGSGVLVNTSGDVRSKRNPDGACELLQRFSRKDKNPSRLVYGVASFRSACRRAELIFEVSA